MLKKCIASLFVLLLVTSTASNAEPVKIGLSLGLTGKYSEMSSKQMKGFRLWEKNVNLRGGILGRKVEIIIYDDKSSPETAASYYEHLINKEKVDLLFAPYSSQMTEAILPVSEKYGYPVIASGASADSIWEQGHKYVFGLYTVASKYAVGFLELLVKNKFSNVAIVYADDSFSIEIAKGTKEWAIKFGLKVLLFEKFKKEKSDLDDVAKMLKNSTAQVLIVCGHYNESINMRLSLKNINWSPKVYYASVGPAFQNYYQKLGADSNHTFTSTQWERHGKLPGSEKFYDLYVKAYGETPSYHAASAFAAGQIIETAVKKAGGLDRKTITDVLSAMNTMSIMGRYGVDRAGRQVRHFPLIIQWQNGKKEIVWPEELATAKPLFKK